MAAAIEMATKDREYITKYQIEVGHVSSEYNKSVANCASVEGWSDSFTIAALATVTCSVIKMVYPLLNAYYAIMDRQFYPIDSDCHSYPVLTVMWSRSTMQDYSPREWSPNHFVPIFSSPKKLTDNVMPSVSHTSSDSDSCPTGDHPIFLGPTYLHWDATEVTYFKFLQHTKDVLSGLGLNQGPCVEKLGYVSVAMTRRPW